MKLPHIGITGHMGAGKDSCANILVRDFGYTRRALADALKADTYKALMAIDPKLMISRYKDVGEWLEFLEIAKRGADGQQWVRKFLQFWGTEVMRNWGGEDYWVKRLDLNQAIDDRLSLVVPDVRFPNEAQSIHYTDGLMLRVNREGFKGDNHASEIYVDTLNVDANIDNNGSLYSLAVSVHQVMDKFGIKAKSLDGQEIVVNGRHGCRMIKTPSDSSLCLTCGTMYFED